MKFLRATIDYIKESHWAREHMEFTKRVESITIQLRDGDIVETRKDGLYINNYRIGHVSKINIVETN